MASSILPQTSPRVESESASLDLMDLSLRNVVTKVFNENPAPIAECLFRFPEHSTITMNPQRWIDVSGIEFNLGEIFRGGIGWGAQPGQLMAKAMESFGHRGSVYNLPLCMEGYVGIAFECFDVVSAQGDSVEPDKVRDSIEEAIGCKFTMINMPISFNGHASLLSIDVSEDPPVLIFYDSLSENHISYEQRYDSKLTDFINSFLPTSMQTRRVKFLHLLDQGDAQSTGCGYYALYTALILSLNKDIQSLVKPSCSLILDEMDDKKIRADLVVRTLISHMITYGADSVNISDIILFGKIKDIFARVPGALPTLMAQLRPRIFSA